MEAENIRAADAKEVGVGNPAEETYCYPNVWILGESSFFVNLLTRLQILGVSSGKSRSWFVLFPPLLAMQSQSLNAVDTEITGVGIKVRDECVCCVCGD